jgi:hypothetical protein
LEWWKNTKQLEHGSLICLWYEPQARVPTQGSAAAGSRLQLWRPAAATPSAAEAVEVAPVLVFASVVDKDARKLADGGSGGYGGTLGGATGQVNTSGSRGGNLGGVRPRLGIR